MVEGDATLAMIAYGVFSKTKLRELTGGPLTALRTQLERFAASDTSTMVATMRPAKVFYDAYTSTLETRYPAVDPGPAEQQRWVVWDGDRVYIVDGGAQDTMDVLIEGATFERAR